MNAEEIKPEQERVLAPRVHDGDYVEVVENRVKEDSYIGKRGYALGQPWSKDAPKNLPVALMLEDDPAFGPTFFHPDELKVITRGSASRLLAAHAEALEREVRLRAIHQEKAKRLNSLRRYVWEQYRRKISEMKDVGRDLDFILAMPLHHPETGAVVTVDESLEIARQALTATQEAQQ